MQQSQIKNRGRQFVGTVVSTKMRKSAVVQWERRTFLKKYERYEKRMTKVTVHVDDDMKIEEGDMVRIAECRPLSKTKHFTIIENLGKEKGFLLKQEGKEESKVTSSKKVEEQPEEKSEEGAEDESSQS